MRLSLRCVCLCWTLVLPATAPGTQAVGTTAVVCSSSIIPSPGSLRQCVMPCSRSSRNRRLGTRRRARPRTAVAAALLLLSPATGFRATPPARWITSHAGSASAAASIQQQCDPRVPGGARFGRDRWALNRCGSHSTRRAMEADTCFFPVTCSPCVCARGTRRQLDEAW